MKILFYQKFLEARLGDILKIKGDNPLVDEIRKHQQVEFDVTKKLPTSVRLESGQTLNIKWNDSVTHNLVKRLKERTNFRNIEHFTEVISKKFTKVFPWMVGKELYQKGKYSLYLQEYNISIIISFDINKNMGDSYFTNILTILPGRKGNNVVNIIDIL